MPKKPNKAGPYARSRLQEMVTESAVPKLPKGAKIGALSEGQEAKNIGDSPQGKLWLKRAHNESAALQRV